MVPIEDGGPAFPVNREAYYGMTLRDWFAGLIVAALVGYVASLLLMAERYRVGVWGPHVSIKGDEYPWWARANVVRIFSRELEMACAREGWRFWTVWGRLVGMPLDRMREYFCSDESHLGELAMAWSRDDILKWGSEVKGQW